MPKSYPLPFNNQVFLQVNGEINSHLLQSNIESYIDFGVCLIIRPEQIVNENHGGYLFNIQRSQGKFLIFSISKRKVYEIDADKWDMLCEFVNHFAGRKYSPIMWEISHDMNFLLFNEEVGTPN